MGGLGAETIESPASAKSKPKSGSPPVASVENPPTATQDIIKLEWHEDPVTGQVHFHDRTNNLKVGIPVAKMFQIWDKIEHGDQVPPYYDAEHNTLLTFANALNTFTTPFSYECVFTITPVQQGATFQKFNQFMKDRRKRS